jgi:6-phosphogluconolactonase
VGIVHTGGKEPRSFEIDPTGALLFAENEKSNNIVVFRIDAKTGNLAPTGQVFDVSEPVCLKFLAIK